MSDVKWIKVNTDIFDNDKILIIESMQDADTILVIWFKLLCLAGKQNNSGVFMLTDTVPYNDEMFAAVLKRPLQIVRTAFKTFVSLGMVEIVNDVATLPSWGRHQNLESIELRREKDRERKKEFRQKQAMISAKNDVSTKCPADVQRTSCGRDTDIRALEGEGEYKTKKEIGHTSYVSAELSSSSSAEAPSEFYLALNNNKFYNIPQSDVEKYKTLYRAIDVESEIRAMIGWLDANPARRKTDRGVKAFITSWLKRSQDRGGVRRNAVDPRANRSCDGESTADSNGRFAGEDII